MERLCFTDNVSNWCVIPTMAGARRSNYYVLLLLLLSIIIVLLRTTYYLLYYALRQSQHFYAS